MPEVVLASARSGLLLRRDRGALMLHRLDDDRVERIGSDALHQIAAGSPDLRATAIDSLEQGKEELRLAKDVLRATRLFLILVDPDEPDEGLGQVAVIADERLANPQVYDRARSALLASPLGDVRLDRATAMAAGLPSLSRFTKVIADLQLASTAVAELLASVASERFRSLADGEAFLVAVARRRFPLALTEIGERSLYDAVRKAVRRAPVDGELRAIEDVIAAHRHVRERPDGAQKIAAVARAGVRATGTAALSATGLVVGSAAGRVKFFNGKKGFGFISRDDGADDVFVHASAVEEAGLVDLGDGQQVAFKLVDCGGRVAAADLELVGKRVVAGTLVKGARGKAVFGGRGKVVAGKAEGGGEKASGTVKFFNAMKGFGFIQRDDGQPDAFVHISAVERAGMQVLHQGDRLRFKLGVEDGKPGATELSKAGRAKG